jgi:hypothetical protein
MDGILSDIKATTASSQRRYNPLTISSRRNHARGEVNEEDVGEAKAA